MGRLPDGYRALVDAVRQRRGTATAEQRIRAFRNTETDPALRPLLDKVATRPTGITDADFDRARAAGLTDDQLFEVVVAAAVGRSTRMYESALAALDEATAG
jgi:alkylhydroperoxidase family enzyme